MTFKKPPRLQPGNCIGLVAPAGAFEKARISEGAALLESRGFRVRFRDDIFSRHRYMAGTDARRAAELMEFLTDPDIHAVLCVRGGYGTQRVVPLLDPAALPTTPKIVIGYSDITVLHAWLHRHAQWGTFYGPTLGPHLQHTAPLDWLLKTCTQPAPIGAFPAPNLHVIKPGTAEGPLVGGCLSLLTHSVGTAYAWPLAGGICFLEDVDEKIYALDRMLTHLKHAGAFEGVKGIVFGTLGLSAQETAPHNLDPMLAEMFADFPGPVVRGLPAGHGDPFFAVPLGCRANLTTIPPTLTVTESAVV